MDFRDFWYVVAESRELKQGDVLARKLLGETSWENWCKQNYQ